MNLMFSLLPSYALQRDLGTFPTKCRKGSLAAGEDEDLLVARGAVEGIEHRLDPVVV